MKGEFYFSCDKVYYDDLEELRKRQCKNDELRLCELSFIAADAARLSRTLLEEGLSPYEILAAIGSIDCIDEAPSTDALGKSLNYIDALSSLCRAADKAILSQLYVQRCKEQGVTVSSRDFFGDGEPEQTFTYVKNPLSDEAFDVFSEDFSDPRVFYASSFSEACLSVAEGRVGYCILPLEEKGGTRISTIFDMIYKHQLKIAAVTPVFGFEGNADVKYALVCQSVRVPRLIEGDDGYIELLVGDGDGEDLTDMLVAARVLELSLYKVTPVLAAEGEGKRLYSVILRDPGQDLSALLVLLTLFYRDTDVFGIYKNLE